MQKLSARKKIQAQNFLNDPNKAMYLYRKLQSKSKSDKSVIVGRDMHGFPVVFRSKIGKKTRAIKLTDDGNIAKWVLDAIKKEHAKAIRLSLIKPKNYVLHSVNFLAVGEHGAIMPLIKAFSCEDLEQVFLCKQCATSSNHLVNNKQVTSFLDKHPWVNHVVFENAYLELIKNFVKLKESSKIPSFDLKSSNIFVLNALDKEKKLVFGLIDQAHPEQIRRLEQQYYAPK